MLIGTSNPPHWNARAFAAWWNGRHSRLKICFWETGVPVRVRPRPPHRGRRASFRTRPASLHDRRHDVLNPPAGWLRVAKLASFLLSSLPEGQVAEPDCE